MMRWRICLKRNCKAFTLMEALISVVIIAVLASVAFPKFFTTIRKISNQEAHHILLTLYGEQMKYAKEHGSFCANITQLDVDIPAPKKFQNLPGGILHGVINCGGNSAAYLASMTSIDNNYTLYVLVDGTIACTPCPSAICRAMGFGDLAGATPPCLADSDCSGNTACILSPGVCVK